MPIPRIYRQSSEGAVASYDSTDIATGVGVKVYFGGLVMSGAYYVLSDKEFYSDDITTTISCGQTTGSSDMRTAGTFNFDIPFQKRNVIKGDAILNIPFTMTSVGDAHVVMVASLQKISDTTIHLCSGASFMQLSESTAKVAAMKLTIPQTVINPGDTLRLKIEAQYGSENGAGTIMVAHDPKGRAGPAAPIAWNAADITILSAQIPFKIDL